MRSIPEGGTLTYTVQLKDPVTGAFLNIDTMSWTLTTHTSSDVTPAAPSMVRVDAYTRHVRIPTAGLGGHPCRTRVAATDPLSSDVYPVDIYFTVDA